MKLKGKVDSIYAAGVSGRSDEFVTVVMGDEANEWTNDVHIRNANDWEAGEELDIEIISSGSSRPQPSGPDLVAECATELRHLATSLTGSLDLCEAAVDYLRAHGYVICPPSTPAYPR